MKLDLYDLKDVVKSVAVSLLISAVLVFGFAFLLSVTNMSESAIMPVNIGIKIISILIGSFIGYKKMCAGLIKGLIVGLLYSLIVYLVYSIINKDFSLTSYTIFDIIACIISGIVSGITVVNVKKAQSI